MRILLIATISIISLFVQMFQAENSDTKESKWFLFNKYMFYIESRQRFTSQQAQQYCVGSQMDNIIQSDELVGLSKLLIKKYELETVCWIIDENFPSSLNTNTSLSKCYALSVSGIYAEHCESMKGVICKQEIYGGSLQYKNGTQLEVGVSDVNQFCNPESNQYDDLLEYCLIKFNTKTLL